jgi:hypothetical protein
MRAARPPAAKWPGGIAHGVPPFYGQRAREPDRLVMRARLDRPTSRHRVREKLDGGDALFQGRQPPTISRDGSARLRRSSPPPRETYPSQSCARHGRDTRATPDIVFVRETEGAGQPSGLGCGHRATVAAVRPLCIRLLPSKFFLKNTSCGVERLAIAFADGSPQADVRRSGQGV